MKIDGREIAQHILDNLTARVEKLQRQYGVTPHLAVVRVGEDPAITSFVNQKKKTAEKIGAKISIFQYDDTVAERVLSEKLIELDKDPQVHGLILQLPVPKHINKEKLINTINPGKDVDGFHPVSKFYVPLAMAVIEVLQEVHFHKDPSEEVPFIKWLQIQNIVILGKGKTGGQPTAELLQKMKLQPIVIDSKTSNREHLLQQADIIIAAVGKEGIITRSTVKPGVILIGVGMNRNNEGKFYGDYDVEEIKDIASFYTPVPGGVGPVNVAKLMENVVVAAERSLQDRANAGRDLQSRP